MPQLIMFLASVAGGCLFGFFTILLVRDIGQTRLYNRVARHYGKPEMLFRLLMSYTLGGFTFGVALGFLGCASVIGFIFIRDTLIR